MKTNSAICGLCQLPANLLCAGCGDIAYCSKNCQKSAWKSGHKNECKPYKIETHPEFGRFLVASRQLKAGSRILTKIKPAICGPPLTILGNSNKFKSEEFDEELCLKLENLQLQGNSQIITPLKFLTLQKSDPDTFAKLLKLESHVEQVKKSERWKDFQQNIISPLKKLGYAEDLISQIVGIICTNSFELLQKDSIPQHGLFELASLMNHDCVGNTRLVIDSSKDGFKMSVFASVPISKGSPILFNYVKPLDCYETRKENLLNFKFFLCQCPRCQDPTEFKTFNSAYLCPICQTGPVIFQDNLWTCLDCKAVIEEAKIRHIDLKISEARKKIAKIQARLDLSQAKQLDLEFLGMLYPSHGFMLEIKQALITCTAAAVNNPGPEAEPQMQRQRIFWCQEILDSLDILEPGLSIGRGMKSISLKCCDVYKPCFLQINNFIKSNIDKD